MAAEIAESRKQLIKSGCGDVEQLPELCLYNDLANAERFLEIFGDEILFVAEKKRWLIWNGSHWTQDRTEQVFERVTEFARQLYLPENLTGTTVEWIESNESRDSCDSCDSNNSVSSDFFGFSW